MTKPTGRPVGRPSKYSEALADRIVDAMVAGSDLVAVCKQPGFPDRASVYRWAEEEESFRTALARAKAHSQTWWEDKAQQHLGTRDFNAQLWLKSVTSRFRDDYTEKQITEVSGPDGGAIKTESVTKIDATTLDPTHREALKAALLAASESTGK